MTLVMEIVKAPNVDIFQHTVTFDTRGGKIGRSKTAKWTLNDPSRHLSNFHAEITYKDGRYYLTDISSNGTFFKTPYKKLPKNTPIPLERNSAFIMGGYTIAVRMTEDTFRHTAEENGGKIPVGGLPDDFFMGNNNEAAYNIIKEGVAQENDIASFVGVRSDPGSSEEADGVILPAIDDLIGEMALDETSSADLMAMHIDPPTFQEPTPATEVQEHAPAAEPPSTRHDFIFKILALGMGIDSEKVSQKEQETFASNIAQLALLAIEELLKNSRHRADMLAELGLGELSSSSFIETVSTPRDLAVRLKDPDGRILEMIRQEMEANRLHQTVFVGATRQTMKHLYEEFSPEKLYFRFEKENRLSKNFTNKKSLAWDAYCETFKDLDEGANTQFDLQKIQTAYQELMRTFSAG